MNTTSPRRLTLTATAAAIVLGSALAAAAPASAAEGALSDIENSLVHVYTEYSGYILYPTQDGDWAWSDEVTAGSVCTGWFASEDGHIATAGHCVQPEQGRRAILKQFLAEHDAEDLFADAVTGWTVEGYEEGSEIDRSVEVIQPDGADDPVIDSWTIAQVVDFQDFEDGDAALLKVAGITGVQPLTVSSTTPEVGDEIVSIGFPGTVQQVVDVQRLGASFKTGTVSSRQVTDGGVPVTEVNAQVSGGMSGGPTIDGNGDVIGINSFGILGEPQSFNFVTDTEALARFLTSHGVDFEAAAATGARADGAEDAERTGTDEGEEAGAVAAVAGAGGAPGSSTDGSPLLGLVIGGMIATVVAGGIAVAVVMIVASRRKAREGSTPTPSYGEQQPVHGVAQPGFAASQPTAQPGFAGSVAPAPVAPAPAYAAPAPSYAAPVGFAAPQPAAPVTAPPLPPLPAQYR